MGSELAVVESRGMAEQETVGALMRRATDVAGVCREIVTKTAQSIQGRKYVRVEGWQSIAVAFGCVASVRDVEEVETGVRAVAEVRRMSDGAVLATAEGFVGKDEPVWFGGGKNPKTGQPYEARPAYARRAMAQTRAVSRVCRSAFAFVVTLIDGNMPTTPAEEMDGIFPDERQPPPAPLGVEKLKHAAVGTTPAGSARKLVPADEPPPHTDADAPPMEDAQAVERPSPAPTAHGERKHDGSLSFAFGRDKGIALADLDEKSLGFYRSAFQRDLADESKAKWHAKTRAQLEAVEAELRWRAAR